MLARGAGARAALGPWRRLPGGMVGEAGSHREAHRISNGSVRVTSRKCLPCSRQMALGKSGHMWQRGKHRLQQRCSQHPPTTPSRGAPGSWQQSCSWREARGLGEAVKGRGRPGCTGAWTRAPDCPLPLELAFGSRFSLCVATQPLLGLTLTSRSYLYNGLRAGLPFLHPPTR